MQDDTHTDRPAAPPIEIDHVIAQLAGHQAYLAAHIDRHWDDLEPFQLARTLSLYGQNAARLGRLFLDRAAAYGADCDEWHAECQDALRRMDTELFGGSFGTAAAIGEDDAAAGGPITAQASPDINAVITDLSASQDRLSNYLDRYRDDLDPRPMERLLAVYSQNAARLGRLLRYRSDIYGPPVDPIDALMDEALDRFWAEVDAGAEADQHRADSPPEPPTDPFSDSITDSLADSFLDSLVR
jgi:hypothetical protein